MTISSYPWDERPKPKLAQQIADEIEREILARGLNAGENLGTEAELVQRHGVSRSILREALLLVQRSGLADVKRGKVGGLVVNAPGTQRIAQLLQNYIGFMAHDFQDVLELRRGLEDHMLRAAHAHLSDADMEHMTQLSLAYSATITPRQRATLCLQMLNAISRASANPLLNVLVTALAGATHEHMIRRNPSDRIFTNSTRKIYDLRHEQMRALMAADIGHALALNEQIHHEYDVIITLVHDLSPLPHSLSSEVMTASYRGRAEGDVLSLEHKLAEKVARRIRDTILLGQITVGTSLGNELSLMHQYKVSRGVVREAIRILERLEMVHMTRGKNGGLKVTRPDPLHLVRTASIYIHTLGLQLENIRDIANSLELIIVGRAAQNIQNVESQNFAAALTAIRSASSADYESLDHAQLDLVVQMCGSHIAGLLLSLVVNLHSVEIQPDFDYASAQEDLRRAGVRMIEHILKGDATTARRAMVQRQRIKVPMRVRGLGEIIHPHLLKIVKP